METDTETPLHRIVDALEREDYSVLEAHLAAESRLGAALVGEVKACFDWNGHHVSSVEHPQVRGRPVQGGAMTPAAFEAHTADVCARAARAAGGRADRALLCLWARYVCRKAWGHTYRLGHLTRTYGAFRRAVTAAWGLESPGEDPLLRALRLHCELLGAEIWVEDQLQTGSMTLHRNAIEDALSRANAVVDAASEVAARGAERRIAAYVAAQAEGRQRHIAAQHASNVGVRAAIEGRAEELAEASETVEKVVAATPPDAFVELSEIGALQQSLRRFWERQDAKWLRVDRARIAYLFPFGTTGIDYGDLVRRLRGYAAAALVPEQRRERDAVRPTGLSEHFTAHADVWSPHVTPDQRFDGVELQLPEVTLKVRDGTEERLQASIRFTSLGMHCLRLERPVKDLRPHELNAVLRRGLREHGTVRVTCAGVRGEWTRLSRLARSVLNEDLRDRLAGAPGKGRRPEPVEIHRGRPHVLMRIQHASEYEPGREDEAVQVGDGERLLNLFGASGLVNAAPATKESIGDWARLSGERHKLIAGLRNEGDVLVSNENSTIIAALDTPSYISAELEALAEFTASFGGALEAWNRRLDDYGETVRSIVDAYGEHGADRGLMLRRMQRERTGLTRFENEVRGVISLLYSPGLLRSSSNSAVLRRLLVNSGIEGQIEAFRGRLTEVAADQSEANLQRWEADRQQQVRESISISLGAVGVCAAYQIWQAAGLWNDRGWTAVTSVTVAVALVYMFRRWPVQWWGWLRRHAPRRHA